MRSKVSDIFIRLSLVENGDVIQALLDIIGDLVEDDETDGEVYEEVKSLLENNDIEFE